MAEKLVVIGGVAAGLKAAASARRNNPGAEITVLEKGNLVSYGACGMPYYVAGDVETIQQLMMTPAGAVRNPDFFRNVKNITVLTGTEATAIDRAAKKVVARELTTGAEKVFPYDKLVLATGAVPIKPGLPGVDLGNIHQFWHPRDAEAVREGLAQGRYKRVVIIGAGLVGLEMAEAVKQWDAEVTMVEMRDQILAAALDEEIAGAVAQAVTARGITLLTGEKVVRFQGDSVVRQVVTDKRTLPADLVILAMGVRPNVELARAAGLTIGASGAIAVDERLQTSDPDIYAGGDCAENTHILSGQKLFTPMGSTANKHGRVIGDNICGKPARFRGVLGTMVVKILDMNVGKTGLTEREVKQLGYEYITAMAGGHDRPHYMPGAKLITVKLVADPKTRKLLGAQVFGEGEVAKRVDIAAALLTTGGTLDDLSDLDLSYAPPFNSPIDTVAVAANVVINKLSGKFRGISPQAAKAEREKETTVFLDVRSADECKQLRLAGGEKVRHIPLGELRNRLDELAKNNEIIALCKIGLRGYEAALILEGDHFENVKVLEGGLNAWPYEKDT